MKLFVLVILVALLTGCGGSGGSTGSLNTNTTPVDKTVHEGQVKDSRTGNGLAAVKVSINDFITTTDENGFYTLSDLTTSEEAVVNFKKAGYLIGSIQIQLKSSSGDNSNYLEYGIHAHNDHWNYESTEEIADAHINLDASVVYLDSAESLYHGTIMAELTILDITSHEGRSAFPGAFKGINSNGTLIQFESYGLISISLKDSDGNNLRLAEAETVTLGFDAVSSLGEPDILPLWYYDYDQGLWFEEGYALLQEDGSYKGEISHLGTWSLNRGIEDEPAIYRGRIIDKDGSPMGDVRIHALGDNWISSDLSTDKDGMFEIEIIPGESFKLAAYDYKNKYGANYNGIIEAIASGLIVDEQ